MKNVGCSLLCLLLLVSCGGKNEVSSDIVGDERIGVLSDVSWDVVAGDVVAGDLAVDVVADAADVSVPATLVDETNGLMWQTRPEEDWLLWSDARARCDVLELEGYSDWRLPTIDELRTLLSGCPDVETDGRCQVADTCGYECYSSYCDGCEFMAGPGLEGCYMDAIFGSSCAYHWSSSSYEGGSMFSPVTVAWFIQFDCARVWNANVNDTHAIARCVRTLP